MAIGTRKNQLKNACARPPQKSHHNLEMLLKECPFVFVDRIKRANSPSLKNALWFWEGHQNYQKQGYGLQRFFLQTGVWSTQIFRQTWVWSTNSFGRTGVWSTKIFRQIRLRSTKIFGQTGVWSTKILWQTGVRSIQIFGRTGVWSTKVFGQTKVRSTKIFGQTVVYKDFSTNKAEIYKDMWGSLQEHLLKNACSSLECWLDSTKMSH